MQAIQCTALTGPKDLNLTELELPVPNHGQVRIKVAAAGINFADTLMSRGKYQEKPPLPFIPGLELAGTIDELGAGVCGLSIGQRVMACVDRGAFAEFAIADQSDVIPLPDSMDFATAAGFLITYGTAIAALDWRAQLRHGETLLVHGAAGGVGEAAVLCGKAMGATVIATARGDAKLKRVLAHGADHALSSERPDLIDEIKRLAPNRVNVAFDPVGGDAFTAAMKTIAWEGRIVVIGFAGGTVPQIPANHLLVKNIAVTGLYWGSYRKHAPERLRESFKPLFGWHATGTLGDISPQVVSAKNGVKAIMALEERKSQGKTVIEF